MIEPNKREMRGRFMKCTFYKRWVCFLTAMLMVLPMLPISQIISYADTEVYLTELDYDSVTTIAGELRFDSEITIGTDTHNKGIYMHPPGVGDTGAASIVYNIGGGNSSSFSVTPVRRAMRVV